MNLLYIVSHGHTGSTLADLILGSHPKGLSLGEINMLPVFARKETAIKRAYRCSCEAEDVFICKFWSAVENHLSSSYGLKFQEMNLDHDNQQEFEKQNTALLNSIHDVSHKSFAVDSSKSLKRLLRLQKVRSLNVIPIHLIRGPRGQIASMLRKHPHHSLWHHAMVYNWGLIKACLVLFFKPHYVIHYESMVEAPGLEMNPVLKSCKLSFDPSQKKWASQERHLIGGNGGVKFTKDSSLVRDDRWKKSLTSKQIFLIDALTFPAIVLLRLKKIISESK